MITLGVGIGETESGAIICDGGAAIAKDGKIVAAIGEERVSRHKYAGGFDHSVPYLMKSLGLHPKDIDCCALSFCGQHVRDDLSYWIERSYLKELEPQTRIISVPSHHLSHALTAYHFSGFDDALIVVFDNEGNALDGTTAYPEASLRNPYERSSYYVGKGGAITLHHRDHDGVNEVSLGDAYRQFTHFCGFPSGLFSGKTMGLAAYGNPDRFTGLKLFDLKAGKIVTLLGPAENNPGLNVQHFFESQGIDIGTPAKPGLEPGQREADVARFVQDQLESIVCRKIQYLVDQTGIKRVCLGGGVAYNVLMNSAILERTSVEQLFIHPAAGDQGQGVGNALYAYQCVTGNTPPAQTPNAFLGPIPLTLDIQSAYQELQSAEGLSYFSGDNMLQEVAKQLASGKFVGWFQGGSEMGPRSLGHRSILADPRGENTKETLNARIKYREAFRPFAPSVTSRQWHDYFDGPQENPFMLFSAKVRIDSPISLPAITHKDRTARPQSVTPEENSKFHSLLVEFGKLSACEVLLNTSFNLSDEAIVETPQDAVKCFLDSNLDALVLEDYLIVKS